MFKLLKEPETDLGCAECLGELNAYIRTEHLDILIDDSSIILREPHRMRTWHPYIIPRENRETATLLWLLECGGRENDFR